MTNKKQPEALRLAEMLTADEWPGSVTLVSYARECVAELRRLHAYCQELESQVILDCMTHDSKPLAAGQAVAPAELTPEQIEAMPVWRNFVGLWPESRQEIVRAVEEMLNNRPAPPAMDASPSAASIAWNALRDATDPLGELGARIMGHVRIFAQRQYEAGRDEVRPDKTPTDSEILDAAEDFRSQYKHGGTTFDDFDALAFARARLLEADLAKLTARGAVAWPGIDAQDLRDGGKP